MAVVVKSFFIVLSAIVINSHSLHLNSSYKMPHVTMEVTAGTMKSLNDVEVSKTRQNSNSFGVGGPVAASLAFVGLNLAFISLLVPFVITAVSVGERRNYHSDEDHNPLSSQLNNLRNLYGWDPQDMDYSKRSSSNGNKDVMDKLAKFGQKLLSHIKTLNRTP